MDNFKASVSYGVAALVLMALAFHMTGDDFGVALAAITAALAWASCYCTALFEQTSYRNFATAGIVLTLAALVVGVVAVLRLGAI